MASSKKTAPEGVPEKVLVLRTCAADGKSYNDFQWPLKVGVKVSAPDWKPNSAIAVATASSKKLLAPISAEGPATHHSTPRWRFSQ